MCWNAICFLGGEKTEVQKHLEEQPMKEQIIQLENEANLTTNKYQMLK